MVNLVKKFVADVEMGRIAHEYGVNRDEMMNEAQRLGWDEVDNGGVAEPVETKVDRFLKMVRVWIERDGGDMDKALAWMYADDVKARPTAQEFGRLLDTYRSAIQYGIDDHIEAAGFALDEWVERALGVQALDNDKRQVREDSQGLGEPGRLSPYAAGVVIPQIGQEKNDA